MPFYFCPCAPRKKTDFTKPFLSNQSITVNSDSSSKPELWLRRLKRLVSGNQPVIAGSALVFFGLLAAILQYTMGRHSGAAIAEPLKLSALHGLPENIRWGFDLDEYQLDHTELRSGDVLGEILMSRGLTYPQVHQLVAQCKDKFNIGSFRMGQKLYFLKKGIAPTPQYMVYEPSPYGFTVFQLEAPYEVKTIKPGKTPTIRPAIGF